MVPSHTDTPVAGEIQVGDVGEKESSMGRQAGQPVIVQTQSSKARHVPQPLPGKSRQEVPVQPKLPERLQINKAAGVDGGDGVVSQPQELQL